MKCASKPELREQLVTERKKLKAVEFELQVMAERLSKVRKEKDAAELATIKLYDKVKLYSYAIKHLESNQK